MNLFLRIYHSFNSLELIIQEIFQKTEVKKQKEYFFTNITSCSFFNYNNYTILSKIDILILLSHNFSKHIKVIRFVIH